MPINLDFLRQPLDFRTVLAGLRPRHWPPTAGDVQEIADQCTALIAGIYEWEGQCFDQPLIDEDKRPVTTPEARRRLAREVALSQEGDIAILLVPLEDDDPAEPGLQRIVRVELRAVVDDFQGPLLHPELILDWVDEEGEAAVVHALPAARRHARGASGHRLSQIAREPRRRPEPPRPRRTHR